MLCIFNKEKEKDNLSSLMQKTKGQIEKAGIIYDIANQLNLDVIILGTKGLKLGSESQTTVSKIIQLAHCPVLVVP